MLGVFNVLEYAFEFGGMGVYELQVLNLNSRTVGELY